MIVRKRLLIPPTAKASFATFKDPSKAAWSF